MTAATDPRETVSRGDGDPAAESGSVTADSGIPAAGGAPPMNEDGLSCGRCGRSLPAPELDRMLWCGGCTDAAKATASKIGWLAGSGLAGALAAWIVVVQQPTRIVLGGWTGAVLATWWLGGRIGRELCFGVLRFRGRPR